MPDMSNAPPTRTRYHLLTEHSLADLNTRLHAGRARAVDFRRFRPNIVVSGARAPYVEDGWLRLRVGGGGRGRGAPMLRQLNTTGRCVIPTTDPVNHARAQWVWYLVGKLN